MACLVFPIKLISSSDTLTKREAAILKICPPVIITSAEVIIAEYDAILGQWERKNFYNHLSNYTNNYYYQKGTTRKQKNYGFAQLQVTRVTKSAGIKCHKKDHNLLNCLISKITWTKLLNLHVTHKWTKRWNRSNEHLPSHHQVYCNCCQQHSSNTTHNNYSYKEILWLLTFYRSIRMSFHIPFLKVQTNHCCYYFVHSGFLLFAHSK